MPNPHQPSSAFLVSVLVALSFLTVGLANPARAQEPQSEASTERGIQLYKKGDVSGAARVLEEVVGKHPEDADAWYYLALAFHSQGWVGAARPAFERAVELRPDSADAHAKLSYALILANEPQQAIVIAERAIELGDHSAEPHYALAEASLRIGADGLKAGSLEKAVEEATNTLRIDPDFSLALITKSFAQYKLEQYSEAAASLERYLALNPHDADADVWREQLMLRALVARAAQSPAVPDQRTTFGPKEVSTKARVLSKPEPQYTEAARRAGVQGTIVFRAVFSADGGVKHVRVVQALPFGLTTASIQAARQIKFTPAIKDGRPVSMYIQLEYNFNLY